MLVAATCQQGAIYCQHHGVIGSGSNGCDPALYPLSQARHKEELYYHLRI